MDKHKLAEIKRSEMMSEGFAKFMSFTTSEECDDMTMDTKLKWIKIAMAPFAHRDEFKVAPDDIIDGSGLYNLVKFLLDSRESQPSKEDIGYVVSEVTKRASHSITRPLIFQIIWKDDSIFHNAYQTRLYELYQTDTDFHERTVGYISREFINRNFTPEYLSKVSLKYLKYYTLTAMTNGVILDIDKAPDNIRVALIKHYLKAISHRTWIGQFLRANINKVIKYTKSYEHLLHSDAVLSIINILEKGGTDHISYKCNDSVAALREYLISVNFRKNENSVTNEMIECINKELLEACDSLQDGDIHCIRLVFTKKDGIMRFTI